MKCIIFGVLLIVLLSPVNAQQTTTTDPGVTPDSFLWGLDKAFDQITLLLATGDVDKAKKGLEIAEERLAEIREMIEENKLEEAEKAQESHGKTLLKIKEKVKEVEEDDSLQEIEKVIEIEKELEEHDDDVEQTFGELKVKIEIEGEITQEQKDLIDSILNSLKGQTGEVEIEIENKKNKIKIKIEQETGKSEEEIEIEIESKEKEKGIKKQENGLEAIKDAEEELNELLEEAGEENITISQEVIDQFNSLLNQAKSKFDQGDYVDARRLAKQAEKLLDDEKEEEELNEIEVKIEDGKAEIVVEIGDSKWKFELETIDLDTIINEIAARTGLSSEEINAIMKVEIEENGDEEEQEIGSNLPALYTQTLATKAAAESLSAHSKNIFKASGLEELLKKPEQAEAPVAKKPKSDDKKEVEKQQKLEKEREIALKYTKGDFTDWAYAGLIARDKDYGSQTASIARQDSIQKAKGKDLSGKLFADGLESTGIEGSVYNETFSYARAGAHAEMTFNHYIKSLKVDDVIEMAGLKNENPKYAGAYLSELLEGKDEEGKAFASTLIGVYTDYVTSKKASEALAGFTKSSTEQANKYLAKPKEEKEGGK